MNPVCRQSAHGCKNWVALLAALALAAAGCGGSSEGGSGEAGNNGAPVKGKKGGKVTFLAAADVDYLDPGQTYYTFGYTVAYATQRPLYSFKPDDARDAGAGPRRGRAADLEGQQDRSR